MAAKSPLTLSLSPRGERTLEFTPQIIRVLPLSLGRGGLDASLATPLTRHRVAAAPQPVETNERPPVREAPIVPVPSSKTPAPPPGIAPPKKA